VREVFLGDGAGKNAPWRLAVQSFWIDRNHRGQAVFHFAGCASISDAEKLRGLDVLLPIEQRLTLPAGQYFISDLIGCSVFAVAKDAPVLASPACSSAIAPELLGVVSDVQRTGDDMSGTPLLVVDRHQGELLIPLAHELCVRIDTVSRRIDVHLPEGLRELNE
jgi:16S rRNA processing protein RimM